MPRVLASIVLLVLALLALPNDGQAADRGDAVFDASSFSQDERRLIQTALAAAGDYGGPLDGLWGAESQAAMTAWSGRTFSARPANAHVAVLALDFLDSATADGWDFREMPDLGLSLALPLARLGKPEDEEGATRWWSRDGGLTLLLQTQDAGTAAGWHDAAEHAAVGGLRTRLRTPDRMETTGTLSDGRRFFTRSERVGSAWSMVFMAADQANVGRFTLMAASLRLGAPDPWSLPEDGMLAHLIADEHLQVVGAAPEVLPVIAAPNSVRPRSAVTESESTGTGFYIGPRTLVTAAHVVTGCHGVTLSDGTALRVVASDSDRDVAVLTAPRPAPTWLSLADRNARLGQRVHAVGFPYYAIAGTSLNLTSGNVSALAGVDDDPRFFSFSAPVQPGNSGGPLIDARGRVLGLVVARLSEDYIVETTGSLPQNVNYALAEGELADFLDTRALTPVGGGLGAFDMDDGAPDDFEAAIVPLLCN